MSKLFDLAAQVLREEAALELSAKLDTLAHLRTGRTRHGQTIARTKKALKIALHRLDMIYPDCQPECQARVCETDCQSERSSAGYDRTLGAKLKDVVHATRTLHKSLKEENEQILFAQKLLHTDDTHGGEQILIAKGAYLAQGTWKCKVRVSAFYRRSKKLTTLSCKINPGGKCTVELGKTIKYAINKLERMNKHFLFTIEQARDMEQSMKELEDKKIIFEGEDNEAKYVPRISSDG